MLKYTSLLLAGLLFVTACTPVGDLEAQQTHADILHNNNGLSPDAELQAYVTRIGQRIIAATPAARDDWDIYVLDSARVNAYVIESGKIYVTRGLLMLANSEAELAAVIAHEIAHLAADHSGARAAELEQVDQQILAGAVVGALLGGEEGAAAGAQIAGNQISGGIAAFSRSQEADADRRGLDYLANAGYAPEAMADFLSAMIAHGTLSARLAGGEYDPSRTDTLASHPASNDRLAAVRAALQSRPGGDVGRDSHLDRIDGLVWGANGRNGLIRDNRWIDPLSGLSFAAPAGMSFDVTDFDVSAGTADGLYLNFERTWARDMSPEEFLTEVWLPNVRFSRRASKPSDVQTRNINGRAVAYADLTLQSLEGRQDVRMVTVGAGREILQFVFMAPQNVPGAMDALFGTLNTIQILPASRLVGLRPTRIEVVTVLPRQDLGDLVDMMQVSTLPRAHFLALNNLAEGARLQPGQRVKILQQ